MKIIVEDLASQSMDSIFYYNLMYSRKNAIETDSSIKFHINNLSDFPYIGRYIPEMSDKRFREIIYTKSKHSKYRIMYYISDISKTIYVFNVMNSKQDFISVLKLHNYFKNYFKI